MKVIKYKVLLDEENKNILVKESAQLYASEKGQMNTPAQIVHLCNDVLQANRLAEEHLWLLAFNTKNKLLGLFEVSHGTVNGSLITPREIFVRLFLCGAVRFVLVHNHPSGGYNSIGRGHTCDPAHLYGRRDDGDSVFGSYHYRRGYLLQYARSVQQTV